jgi:hypothetical protein
MTDKQTKSPYFWQEAGCQKAFEWYEKSYFLSVAEWVAGEINEQTKELTKKFTVIYDKDKELGDYLICNICNKKLLRINCFKFF